MKHLLLLLSMAAMLVSGCAQQPESGFRKRPVGLQLYSVRTDLEKDFYGTLKRVSDMGFDGVEFYGEYYGKTPLEVKAICTELGLIPFANHVPFAEMMTDLDRVIADNTVIGVQYIVFPYMDTPSRPGVDPEQFKETVARIAEVGTKVREAGFQLLYHNHDFEFAKLPDGTVGHDYIFSTATPKQVQMELDVCWADYAGFDPAQRIREFAGRVPVVHLKDYAVEGKLEGDPYALIGQEQSQASGQDAGKFEFRPLGDGCMDMLSVIRAAVDSGTRWLCVEQDEPVAGAPDRFVGIARSMEYLRQHGLR